jgi:hypothetical protein
MAHDRNGVEEDPEPPTTMLCPTMYCGVPEESSSALRQLTEPVLPKGAVLLCTALKLRRQADIAASSSALR